VTDACYPRHRHQEFLKKVAAAYPGTDLHVLCDDYTTHKHAEVRRPYTSLAGCIFLRGLFSGVSVTQRG
jgi:hypothetical protein